MLSDNVTKKCDLLHKCKRFITRVLITTIEPLERAENDISDKHQRY